MLPNFLVIGAPKAGTTALYWYLAEHPEVHMSLLKETNFFAYGVDEEGNLMYGDPELHRFPVRTVPDYERLFAEAGDAIAIGEASPIYLESPDAARRAQALVPEARIICGLRNPVDRAYSDYLMYLRSRGRRFDPVSDLSPDAAWAKPDSHWMHIGMYHGLLRRYFKAFPRSQIHMFLFDDLQRSRHGVVQAIYAFLEVDSQFVPDFATPHNVGGVPGSMALERFFTSKAIRAAIEPWTPKRVVNMVRRLRTSNLQAAPALPDSLKADLTKYFRDDIIKTSELIGRDLNDWL